MLKNFSYANQVSDAERSELSDKLKAANLTADDYDHMYQQLRGAMSLNKEAWAGFVFITESYIKEKQARG